MRKVRALLIMSALLAAGCLQVQPQPMPPPTSISSWGPLGGFTMSSGANCAGHATLTNGLATIQDPCFTGSANVVLCTDTSAPVAVSCTPESGSLAVTGAGNDSIAYARVR
jgi:hypothetical protein